jgi:hypothetical protein
MNINFPDGGWLYSLRNERKSDPIFELIFFYNPDSKLGYG